jgi:hypothetical protein
MARTTPASLPMAHTRKMATSVTMTARNKRTEPKTMLESGAITVHPQDPTVKAKLSGAKTSLNLSAPPDGTATCVCVALDAATAASSGCFRHHLGLCPTGLAGTPTSTEPRTGILDVGRVDLDGKLSKSDNPVHKSRIPCLLQGSTVKPALSAKRYNLPCLVRARCVASLWYSPQTSRRRCWARRFAGCDRRAGTVWTVPAP